MVAETFLEELIALLLAGNLAIMIFFYRSLRENRRYARANANEIKVMKKLIFGNGETEGRLSQTDDDIESVFDALDEAAKERKRNQMEIQRMMLTVVNVLEKNEDVDISIDDFEWFPEPEK